MQLTKNFNLREFTKSNTAARLGIKNDPTAEHIHNLAALCENVLQPLREALGQPIRITSGYRSEALNEAIGGSKTSDHSFGRAADLELYVEGKEDNASLFNVIKTLDLPFKQLIYEFGDEEQPDWVHVAFEKGSERHETLQAYKDKGKTKYKFI